MKNAISCYYLLVLYIYVYIYINGYMGVTMFACLAFGQAGFKMPDSMLTAAVCHTLCLSTQT